MIEGYVVVVKPENVGRLHGDRLNDLMVDGKRILYQGMDREPWFHLDELFYSESLGEELKRLRREIEAPCQSEFSPGICVDLSKAKMVHALAAQCGAEDDILWIESRACEPTHDRQFLGYDIYVDGFGSLIRLGIFTSPEVFRDYENSVNEHGLFSDLDTIRHYTDAYCRRCQQANLEPIEVNQATDDAIFRIFQGLSG